MAPLDWMAMEEGYRARNNGGAIPRRSGGSKGSFIPWLSKSDTRPLKLGHMQ